jgi:protein-disulfide isomerase
MHNWARRAALATICASFQGNEFFWPLHDFLFASQNNLTAATLDAAVGRFMERDVQFSADEYRGCMEQHKAEVILQRDEALAESYHVEATPTIFINGVRKMGFGSPDQLRAAIRSAITAAQGRSNGEK